MKYSEAVYKRIRNGRVYYDGMLRYYDEQGKRHTLHRERTTRREGRFSKSAATLRTDTNSPTPASIGRAPSRWGSSPTRD